MKNKYLVVIYFISCARIICAQQPVYTFSFADTQSFDYKDYRIKKPPRFGFVEVYRDTLKSRSIIFSAAYKNFKQHGKMTLFTGFDSTVLLECYYEKGQKNGLSFYNDLSYSIKDSRNAFFSFKKNILNGYSAFYCNSDSIEYILFTFGKFNDNKKEGLWMTFRKKSVYGEIHTEFQLYKLAKYYNGIREKEFTHNAGCESNFDFKFTPVPVTCFNDQFLCGSLSRYYIYDANKLKGVISFSRGLDTILYLEIRNLPYVSDSVELFSVGNYKEYYLEQKEDLLKLDGDFFLIFRKETYNAKIENGILSSNDSKKLQNKFHLQFDLMSFVLGGGLKR